MLYKYVIAEDVARWVYCCQMTKDSFEEQFDDSLYPQRFDIATNALSAILRECQILDASYETVGNPLPQKVTMVFVNKKETLDHLIEVATNAVHVN